MLNFLQMIVNGIAAGSAYALMGLAMVLIYKTSEVPNFAQGEMALVGSYVAYMLLDQYGLPSYAVFPAALAFAFFLGCVLEFAVLRRAKEPNVLGMIVITIGLEMVLMGLVSWKFGADQKTMPFPISPYDSLVLGKLYVSTLEAAHVLYDPGDHGVSFPFSAVFQAGGRHESHPAERHGRPADGDPDPPHPHGDMGDFFHGGVYGGPAHFRHRHAALHDVGSPCSKALPPQFWEG